MGSLGREKGYNESPEEIVKWRAAQERRRERGIILPWEKDTTTPTESNSHLKDGTTTDSTPPTT